MLMVNATRHFDANLSGVYPRPSIWVGKAMRRFGEGGAAATRQQFKQGVDGGNPGQALFRWRSKGLCRF